MNGLLDFIKTPEGQGLLSATFAGMAGARRGQPINTLGAAGLGGLLGYTRAIDNQSEQQVREMQANRYKLENDKYQNALNVENTRKGILPKLGTQKSFAPTIENEQNPQMWTPQDIYGELMRTGDLEGATAFMNAQPKYNIQRNAQGEYVYMPEQPGQGQVTPTGVMGHDKEAALPWYVRKGESGFSIDPAYADLERTKAAYGRPPAQPMQGLSYVDTDPKSPTYGKTIWGTINEARGKPSASYTPEVIGARERAKEREGEIGKGEGELVVSIPGKEAALDSVKTARKTLQEGINAGIFANAKQVIGKTVGDEERAARTEEFKSYIGNTVIPRLKEFGGNDSNEEMRYLQGVMGGDITMEPKALEKILADSERKIQAGIDRAKGVQAKPPGAAVNSGTDLGGGFRVK